MLICPLLSKHISSYKLKVIYVLTGPLLYGQLEEIYYVQLHQSCLYLRIISAQTEENNMLVTKYQNLMQKYEFRGYKHRSWIKGFPQCTQK